MVKTEGTSATHPIPVPTPGSTMTEYPDPDTLAASAEWAPTFPSSISLVRSVEQGHEDEFLEDDVVSGGTTLAELGTMPLPTSADTPLSDTNAYPSPDATQQGTCEFSVCLEKLSYSHRSILFVNDAYIFFINNCFRIHFKLIEQLFKSAKEAVS